MSDHTQSPLKQKFWTQMSKSPFVMLELDNVPHSAVPMTAQLDKEAHGAIWFFTSRESPLAQMGPATATFVAKDHKLFARLTGRLTEETDQERFDTLWTSAVAAWFPEGKGSPHVLLMRMELGEASLWGAKLGAVTLTKMLLGINVYDDVKEQRADTSL